MSLKEKEEEKKQLRITLRKSKDEKKKGTTLSSLHIIIPIESSVHENKVHKAWKLVQE